jgi:hypothetical protein
MSAARSLSRVIEAAAQTENWSLKDLTVLAPQNDPFRFDTPSGHRDGVWFAEQLSRFVAARRIHLRGLHYLLVAAASVLKPNGMPYINIATDYAWFGERASKAARWLGYVPFDRIIDERNEAPEIDLRDPPEPLPQCRLRFPAGERDIYVPPAEGVLPYVDCDDPEQAQPYRIVLIGEKSSLGPALRQPWGIDEVLLPSGEISDTLIAELAERANRDLRPTTVLYFSDFDPGGRQMPLSAARKLQALRFLKYPDLDVQVHHVALTLEQVIQHNLPSTPLKDTELRASRWRQVMGREQTEIDALAALRPEILRQIVDDALVPFRDVTLALRARQERARCRQEAEELLQKHPDYEGHCAAIRAAHEELSEAARRLQDCQAAALRELEPSLALPDPSPIEPEIEVSPPLPLFDSEDDYVTATRRLIDHKKLNGEPPS